MKDNDFDNLFDDDFFKDIDSNGSAESVTKAQSLEDMTEEEIEIFKQSDTYNEYKAEVTEVSDVKANMKGKTVQEIMSLADRDKSIGYSYNSLEHFDIEIDIYQDIVDQSPVMQDTVEEGVEIFPTFKYLHEDIFLSLLKYKAVVIPEDKVHTSTRINRKIILKLINTPEYIALRKTCRLDQFNAALGTEIIGQKALDIIRELVSQMEDLKQKKDALKDLLDQEKQMDSLMEEMEDIDQLIENAKQAGNSQLMDELQDQLSDKELALSQAKDMANQIAKTCDELIDNDDMIEEVVQVVSGTLSETDKQVKEVSDLCEAWGLSDGGTNRVAFQEKKEAIETIRRSNKLTKLTDMIGRFKESAIAEQKKKSKHGAVEIDSVTVGNKIQDTLPSDRMNLTKDVTKKDFYRRMTENQLMTYNKKSHNTKNKGPIIVCVDTSGSMGTSEEMWSKALTVGILEVAQMQKRDFACIIYSGRADDPIVIGKDEIAPKKIIECAERYHGGGTNFESPLNKAIDLIKESQFRDADIMFITDGDCGVSDDFLRKFRRIKEEKEFKTKGILIDLGSYGHCSDATLKEFCDDITLISDVTDLENSESEHNKSIFGSI